MKAPAQSASIISTSAGLADLARTLSGVKRFAVDLEADSLHHYEEQICLMQVSTDEGTWIIDPLAIGDLGALAPVFADPGIEKVFHGADYDVRLLAREAGISVASLFDTMIAAQLLGLREVGLQALLASRFGVVLDKRYQRADWSRRPLPPEFLHYAAEDTRHLLRLRDELASELDSRGRMEWAREEFEILRQVQPAPRRLPSWKNIKGSGTLSPRERAALQSLVEFRDREARHLDRPPFKVVGNAVLLEIASRRPEQMKDLGGIVGLTPLLVKRYGGAIVEAVRTGEEASLDAFVRSAGPRPPRPTHEQTARLARLKAARDQAAQRLCLDPALLCNRAVIEELAYAEPERLPELLSSRLKKWQCAILGDKFKAAVGPSGPKPAG